MLNANNSFEHHLNQSFLNYHFYLIFLFDFAFYVGIKKVTNSSLSKNNHYYYSYCFFTNSKLLKSTPITEKYSIK